MTIEKLEALERAATAGPIELIRYPHGGGRAFSKGPSDLVADFYSEGDRELYTAARNALPALLAVAKAAKAYVNAGSAAACIETREELRAALAQLEATP